MRKLLATLAVVGTLVLGAVAGGAGAQTGISYNVDPGGGTITSFLYIARVYVFYNGYWHWLNCEYVMYSNGTSILNRCW